MTILAGLENIPKHIKEWFEKNDTGTGVVADALQFIVGTYGIVVKVLNVVGPTDFAALKAGILAKAEAAYAADTGDIIAKLEAAGVAGMAEGVLLLAGDLKEAFKDVVEEDKTNLLHTLATSAATESGVPVTA